MSTFTVYGSHGDFVAAGASGRVLEYAAIGDGEYSHIAFFNITEWRQGLSRRGPGPHRHSRHRLLDGRGRVRAAGSGLAQG